MALKQKLSGTRRQRNESDDDCFETNKDPNTPKNISPANQTKLNVSHEHSKLNAIKLPQIKKLKKNFYKDEHNSVIQNALCSNYLWQISEVREHMQSRDCHFSHTLDPKLTVSNQGLSGRCWLFAVLNVMRHELVRKLQLPYNFELSESYLSFYEKMEKCNRTITQFMDKNEINSHDLKVQGELLSGCSDGGHWITCANLIKKYGIIPKSCFKESLHSYDTDEINDVLGYKVREFIFKLVQEKDLKKRPKMKDEMMGEIYNILAKMLGTPPSVDEKIEWSFVLRMDLNEILARENKRHKNNGEFEPVKIKQTLTITPLEFYKKLIVHDLNDYLRFANDPRNPYYEYYESHSGDIVVGGEKNGYYNLPIEDIAQLCVASIKGNTPVEFDCDVSKFMNPNEELLDTKCFNYDRVLGTSLSNMSKKQRLMTCDSYASHAMVLVGFDDNDNKNTIINNNFGVSDNGEKKSNNQKLPKKFKVENSWGRGHETQMKAEDDDSGFYEMSYDWFSKFVYNVVIHKEFVESRLYNNYHKAIQNPVILAENDIMA
jgi:bleomycin hydrolase